jgi:hypothetical protein
LTDMSKISWGQSCWDKWRAWKTKRDHVHACEQAALFQSICSPFVPEELRLWWMANISEDASMIGKPYKQSIREIREPMLRNLWEIACPDEWRRLAMDRR